MGVQRFYFVVGAMANADRLRRISCIYQTLTIIFFLFLGRAAANASGFRALHPAQNETSVV